jgi:hypothetical protein
VIRGTDGALRLVVFTGVKTSVCAMANNGNATATIVSSFLFIFLKLN